MGSFYASEDASSEAVSFSSYTPRVAIVTGAAQGIGRGVAIRLAEDGIDVAINDIPSKQKQLESIAEGIRESGRRAIVVAGDVSSESDVKELIEKTVQELGSVDIMIANAGLSHFSPFTETAVEDLDRLYGVNIRGIFLCLKHASLQMIKQGCGGRLIAASSLAGKQGSPHTAAYCATKFAIRGLTQSACHDLKKYGITVNSYAPGYIRTPMILDATVSDPLVKQMFSSVPVGEPEVIGSLVSYLVKPESFFINGQSITADGGLHFD